MVEMGAPIPGALDPAMAANMLSAGFGSDQPTSLEEQGVRAPQFPLRAAILDAVCMKAVEEALHCPTFLIGFFGAGDGGGMRMTADARAALMQRLSGQALPGPPAMAGAGAALPGPPPGMIPAAGMQQVRAQGWGAELIPARNMAQGNLPSGHMLCGRADI